MKNMKAKRGRNPVAASCTSKESSSGPTGFTVCQYRRDYLLTGVKLKHLSTTGFIIQIVTATGMYQKGQYSKAFTKSGLTLKSSQKMAVATNCKQFLSTVLQHLTAKYKSAKVRKKAPVIFQNV